MPEVKIKGAVTPAGKITIGEGFEVKELSRHSKGWKRFQISFESLQTLASNVSVVSTSKRIVDGGDPASGVASKSRSTVEKVEPAKKRFVVVSGYTKVPTGKPKGGHHGFSFVAVGESPGH